MSHLTDINCTTVLEEIKKEKLKQKTEHQNESADFVNINPEESAFWTDLFANCFLCFESHKNSESITNTLNHDDMLFFVSKIDPEQNKIEVYRRDSKRLPCLTDFNYDWEETVYLNLILHEFVKNRYTLTCAICTQTGAKDLEILKRHSKRVYASPSKRDLQSKGTEETITYPNIYFTVDDFDDAFNEMIVKEGEMVCVELVANDGRFRKVLFLGSIKYESLKKVYDARASTSAKIVNRVTLGSFLQKRVEFVKMKGPGGKGYAEMAVSRHQKHDSSTTPSTSIPSTPLSDNFSYDPLQLFKFSSLRKKSFSQSASAASSIAGTPEIEARDFRQDLIDSSQNSGTFWGRTFGQAFSWINKSNNQQPTDENIYANQKHHILSSNNLTSSNISSSTGISLNAYLTYVTLKLPLIMQDVLETKQKTLLTF